MKYRSKDGLMSSDDLESVQRWDAYAEEMANDQKNWNVRLRDLGIKCAHPDDGWVDRENNVLTVSWYPAFDDGAEVGDLIALGSPINLGPWLYRVCRVTHVEKHMLIFGSGQMIKYTFEDTGSFLGMKPPVEEPKKSFLKRYLKKR